ncbi:MAG: ACT domain-containing protein, partial [Sphingomonadales bacterium]
EDLFEQVGSGILTARRLLKTLFPKKKLKPMRRVVETPVRDWDPEVVSEHAVPIMGLTPGLAVHLASCCHPLPGDRIVGLVEPGEGVAIHTLDCEVLNDNMEGADDWLDVAWQARDEKPSFFTGRVKLIVINEAGALAKIADVVAKQNGNIANLQMVERDPEFFTMLVDVEVRDVKHLTGVSTALRALDVVSSADRLRR